MLCPHDDQKLRMHTDTDGGYVSFNCDSCHGAWLPPKYFNAIKYSRDFDVAAFTKLVKNSATENAEICCPSGCGQLKIAMLEGAELDYCPRCRGIWFDRFEILAAFAIESTSFDKVDLDAVEQATSIWDTYKNLQLVRRHVQQVPAFGTNTEGRYGAFLSSTRYALSLLFKEKEILLFSLLQWLAIAFSYLLWVQILSWIPEEVWRSAAESDGASLTDLVLLLWSLACIGIAAYPVGILTGCMGACHFLRRQHKTSSVRRCIELVLPRAGALWAFHWFDGWITCERILDRLPRKNDQRSIAERLIAETKYYAWKIGISGILPALLTGNHLLKAAKESLFFVKDNLSDIAKLRAGYSALCWIIGVGAYIGMIFLLIFLDFSGGDEEIYGRIYEIYLWATVPIMISLALVMLLLRPIYVIALCEMYSVYLEQKGLEADLPETKSKGGIAFIAFLILCVLTSLVFVFRVELGVIEILSTTYPGG